ncbi:MAG: TIM barrel protein [Oscillospiraceae bacterium]|nr:TIM barrel protein [Oscillospiraceae bacterium]
MSKIRTCVSAYSLQDEFLNKRMDLEQVMHFIKDCGAEGIEIIPDQMLKNAPHISEEDLAKWHSYLKDTGLTPVIADVYLNTNLYKNRTLTHRECIDLLIEEIKMANRMGIPMLRLVSMVPYWVLEPLLPYCEQYNVTLALEIHAGMAFDVKETMDFIHEMKRLDSKYVGLVIDTGIFCRRFPRVVRNYEMSVGATAAMFDYIEAQYWEGHDLHQTMKELGGKLPPEVDATFTDHDRMMFPIMDGYENYPYEALDEYLPYIKHFHFKMFEMTEEGPEYSMDYKGLLQYLHDHDWDGYVATEYEGNRFTLAGMPMQEKKQVAMQQAYLKECLKEIQG